MRHLLFIAILSISAATGFGQYSDGGLSSGGSSSGGSYSGGSANVAVVEGMEFDWSPGGQQSTATIKQL